MILLSNTGQERQAASSAPPGLAGQPGCPHCGGSGWLPAGGAFVRLCACTGKSAAGVFPKALAQAAAGKKLGLEKLEELRRRLAGLIREGTCPFAGPEAAALEQKFLAALANAWGEENAVPRERLEELTGLDERQVKRMVEHLVADHRLSDRGLVLGRYRCYRKTTAQGELILRGYFWCLSAEEALRSSQAFFRQIITSLRTLDAWIGRFGQRPKLRAAIQELEGQYRLSFGEKP